MGYYEPTPIQADAIPILLNEDCDFIGLAQTGTGKTAAYGLPLLHKLNFNIQQTQALILSPTRELCVQIANEMEKFAQFIPQCKIACVYGGVSFDKQVKELAQKPHIVVATPGRMIDHLQRKNAQFNALQYIVLDEADEMLNMGFKEEIDQILAFTPANASKFTWLFSATMPPEIRQIIHLYMNSPKEISIGKKNTLASNIRNEAYLIDKDFRYEALKRIVDFYPDIYGIIFTRTKTEAQEIAEQLIKDGYNADALHGDLSQAIRDKVMNRFRETSLQILVATDVAARGLDVNNITHVIHYGIPEDLESYIHRSGRTARAGKTGVSISIVTFNQKAKIKALEQLLKISIDILPIPKPQDVIEKRLLHFFENFKNLNIDPQITNKYQLIILEQLKDLSREEILLRFSTLEFQRFMEYYKDAIDLNLLKSNRFTRFFVNIGRKDGFDKLEFVQWLQRTTGIPSKLIQGVHLHEHYAFFEVPEKEKNTLFDCLQGIKLGKRTLEIEIANSALSNDQETKPFKKKSNTPKSIPNEAKKKNKSFSNSHNPKDNTRLTTFKNFKKKQ